MRKQRIEYDSPVDALVAIAKRLSVNEDQYRMPSEEFFDKFSKGQLDDSDNFVQTENKRVTLLPRQSGSITQGL